MHETPFTRITVDPNQPDLQREDIQEALRFAASVRGERVRVRSLPVVRRSRSRPGQG